jgi:hypothetical protein
MTDQTAKDRAFYGPTTSDDENFAGDPHADCTPDRHTPRCVAETEWRAAEENELRALWGDR